MKTYFVTATFSYIYSLSRQEYIVKADSRLEAEQKVIDLNSCFSIVSAMEIDIEKPYLIYTK